MKPEAALIELLQRIGVKNGSSVLISTQEFSGWPVAAVEVMKSQGLLTKVRPARSAVCPGCERECTMPVHVLTAKGRESEAFIVCDKRDDVNRVAVPVQCLEQWQASGDNIAALLAKLLGLHRSEVGGAAARWDLGVFKGLKHSSQLVLVAEGKLVLSLASHVIPLSQLLTLDHDGLKIDKSPLLRAIDGDTQQPLAEVGSSVWRKQNARAAADAKHNKPGGSRDKQDQLRDIWASGKYTSRDRCAEEECGALGISFSTARKALRNTPEPSRC